MNNYYPEFNFKACACGSGKKFKNCCLCQKVETEMEVMETKND